MGNFSKSQLALLFLRFDDLHHNIVLIAFSSRLQRTWLLALLYCMGPGFLANTFYFLLTGAENTNAHHSFYSMDAWRRLTLSEAWQ